MLKRMILTGAIAMALTAALALQAQPGATTKPSSTTQPSAGATTKPADAAATGKQTKTPSGLTIIEVAPGDGSAKDGDIVWVHYTGALKNGSVFDSSKGKDPIQFTLGKGNVIRGWDEGIKGMTVGERRQLIIPPELGYGAQGSGEKIPPNSELHFDVELIGIARVAAE